MPVINKIITLENGERVKLVPRKQLRHGAAVKRFVLPKRFGGIAPKWNPPASWDFSKGRTVTFPLDGNDTLGDCYYAAMAHASNAFTANSQGTEDTFDVAALTARYLVVAGGDNGMDDSLVEPEWKGGIIGPNGPHTIWDWLVVPLADQKQWLFAFAMNGGMIWTCSLLADWLNQNSPGSIWDAGSAADPNAGHAMYLSGRNPDGHTVTETWGINPPIEVTDAGLAASDSEFIVVLSRDQFGPDGVNVFTGLPFDQHLALWKAVGGTASPPNPFPPSPTPPSPTPPTPTPPTPTPPTPPTPTPPSNGPVVIPYDLVLPAGSYMACPGAMPANMPPASELADVAALLQQLAGNPATMHTQLRKPVGLTPAQWQQILALIAQIVPLILPFLVPVAKAFSDALAEKKATDQKS